MLRVLLFVEPKPLAEQMFRNVFWADFPIRLCRQLWLDDANSYEFHAASPKRFVHRFLPHKNVFGDRIYAIDETQLIRTVRAHQLSIRDIWISDFQQNTPPELAQTIDNQITAALPKLKWDIVMSFGEECRYSFANDSFCLNMEMSSFGRFPFKPSFFLDHLGMFNRSAPAKLFGAGRLNVPWPSNDNLAATIKITANDIIEQHRKLHFKKRFDRYVLLPLQASNYASFDAQSAYDTQLDYLFDVCDQIGGDTGLIVTEHPEAHSIDRDNQFAMICDGLQDVFPNVTYLPRAKYFSSASLSLLADVEGVWTQASNVGPVASFLGRAVGSPAESHIAYAAHANSPAELVKALDLPHPSNPVFNWMFRRYLVPVEKAQETGWFSRYLKQRYACYLRDGTDITSFCPTNLSAKDFIDNPQSRNVPCGYRSLHYAALLNKEFALFRREQGWRLRNAEATEAKGSFVLVNDTAALETFRHLGCNHVISALHLNMQRIGFRHVDSVNNKKDVRRDISPDWVIVNGEGSFHHNSPRINELLNIALEFKSTGSKLALLNALWESNRPELAQALKSFDVIAVRDVQSHLALKDAGIHSRVAPDLSLDQWRTIGEVQPTSRLLFTDNIVYERGRKLFDAALRLDGDFVLLDDRQVNRYNEDGCFSAMPKHRLSIKLLTRNEQIAQSGLVVTGRFHVMAACIAMNRPFVYVESNTQKMSNLCRDVGLPIEAFNVTPEVDQGDWPALRERIARVKNHFSEFGEQIESYCHRGEERIAEIFAAIKCESLTYQDRRA